VWIKTYCEGLPVSKRLFSLKNVPADEAEEVRKLLTQNGIEFYETPARFWIFSMEAIWLQDEHHYEKARQLIDHYQTQRQQQQRLLYQQAKDAGQAPTTLRLFLNHPLRFLLALLGIAVVLYLSIKPFLSLGIL